MATIRGNLALPSPDSGATNANGDNIIAVPVVIIGSDGNYASLSGGGSGSTGDATAANQISIQSMAGTASTKLVGVQGASGGIPIPVNVTTSIPVTIGSSVTIVQNKWQQLDYAPDLSISYTYNSSDNLATAVYSSSSLSLTGTETYGYNSNLDLVSIVRS